MKWEETVRRSDVIREQHRESLISALRDKPDFNWLVGGPNGRTDRLQGDFFETFPVIYLDPAEKPVSKRQTVMVINNTCYLPPGRSKFVSVAPIFDLARFLEGRPRFAKRIRWRTLRRTFARIRSASCSSSLQ